LSLTALQGYFLRERENFLIRQHGQRHLGLPDHPDKLRPNTAPEARLQENQRKQLILKSPYPPLSKGEIFGGNAEKKKMDSR
jgi:hypothetical protein